MIPASGPFPTSSSVAETTAECHHQERLRSPRLALRRPCQSPGAKPIWRPSPLFPALLAGLLTWTGCGGHPEPGPTCPACRIQLDRVATIRPGDVLMPRSRLVRLADGRLYVAPVADPGSVAIYGPDGTYLTAVGREGHGPGEFDRIFLLTRWAGDTLAVIGRTQGVALVTPAGQRVRSFRVPGILAGLVHDSAGRVYAIADLGNGHGNEAIELSSTGQLERVLAEGTPGAPEHWLTALVGGRVGLVVARGDDLALRRFSPDGTSALLYSRPARAEPWGNIRALVLRGDTAWALIVRNRPAPPGSAPPRPRRSEAELRPRPQPVAARLQRTEQRLATIDLATGRIVASVVLDGILAQGFADATHLYTLDEDSTGNVGITVWRMSIAFPPLARPPR